MKLLTLILSVLLLLSSFVVTFLFYSLPFEEGEEPVVSREVCLALFGVSLVMMFLSMELNRRSVVKRVQFFRALRILGISSESIAWCRKHRIDTWEKLGEERSTKQKGAIGFKPRRYQ